MKVLWFTNILMPDACRHIGRPLSTGSGSWMTVLLERLKKRHELEIAVVWQGGLRDYHFKEDGVEYYIVKTPLLDIIRNRLRGKQPISPVDFQIRKYASIVDEWNPDIVHVHGTESGYGLIKARGFTNKPVAVSIQGLMGPCSANAYGDLLPVQLHGAVRSVIGVKPQCLRRWESFVARVPAEEAILRSADMVLGRTLWDKAWAWACRPDVRYRHVDEMLRPEFHQAIPWSMASCRLHQVFCTSSSQPLKGLHVLLQAVHMLRQVYPDIKLHVASDGFVPHPQNDYARFASRLIRKWNLEGVVTFLGFLDARSIVEQLKQANCYVTPSFIENGCNALQEAMLVGTPCVSTNAGGLITTIESERSGLTFPPGDAALLAWQVARIFSEDHLASRLSVEARIVGKDRNDPVRVEQQLLSAYEELSRLDPL